MGNFVCVVARVEELPTELLRRMVGITEIAKRCSSREKMLVNRELDRREAEEGRGPTLVA